MLFWKSAPDVSIKSFSDGHIDCLIASDERLFRFTGFYGNPDHSKRVHFWELLKRLACVGPANVPWVLGGDFNKIICQNEKYGGPPRPWSQILGFRMALDFCGLKSLTSDAVFSWSNQRDKDASIFIRLDRFLLNREAVNTFGEPTAKVLDCYGSDHRALSLTLLLEAQSNNHNKKGSKRFHFEQKWMTQRDFAADSLMHWTSLENSPLHVKLQECKYFFVTWAGNKFDNLTKQLESLRKRRVSLLNKVDGNFNREELEEVNSQIEKMTEIEEIH